MKRRSSALRSMPVTRDSLHSLYIEIASLQMARSRHRKIRDSLLVQVRKAEEGMTQADQQIATLQARIQALDGPDAEACTPAGQDGEPFVFDY